MRVLLTGGAGYVGGSCLRYLLRQGIEAFAYDDLSEGNEAAVPTGRLRVGNILDGGALEQALRDFRIDVVMHFAAVASVPESFDDPARYWRINFTGTQVLIDAMRNVGVKRLVFSSTASVYSHDGLMPLSEHARLDPVTPYGASKLAAEMLIRDCAEKFGYGAVAMRYFNVCGADPDGRHGESRRSETHLVPLVLSAATGKQAAIKIFDNDYPTLDGTCIRDFVHVEDVARAHEAAAKAIEPGRFDTFNVGLGYGYSVRDVVQACERVVGHPIPIEEQSRRPGDPPELVADSESLARSLKWNAKYCSLDEMIETAWAWHRDYPDGYGDR